MIFTPFIPDGINTSNQTIELTCNFLNETDFKWSTEGVDTQILENGDIKCISTHLTSFAVLLSVTGKVSGSPEEELALKLVGYIGCCISSICLIITIIALPLLGKHLNNKALVYVHFNLALAMLLALVTFMAGLETATGIPILCTMVAALIQYLFLCTFFWMLSEGIMLYLLVVRVFGNAAKRLYLLLILGWGVPLPIVGVSVGVLHSSYRHSSFCWIRAAPSEPAIWTFVGPVILVMAINAVVLVMTVHSIVEGRKHKGTEINVKNSDLVKIALKGSVVLLPLLGLTWVFGLFAVNSNTTLFSWLFTVTNSLQGFLIFFFHVLRNEVFVKKLRTVFFRKKNCQDSLKTSQHHKVDVNSLPTIYTNVTLKNDTNTVNL